jgi:hypothetical protein
MPHPLFPAESMAAAPAPTPTEDKEQNMTEAKPAQDATMKDAKAEEKPTEKLAEDAKMEDAKAEEKLAVKQAEAQPAAQKRAEPEPAVADTEKPVEAAKEPEVKRLRASLPDSAAVRKQIEYYLSDENLKSDKFFHDKISGDPEGWLGLDMIMGCKKIKDMRATTEDILNALAGSKLEVGKDRTAIRRPGNAALPTLQAKPRHEKRTSIHAHDGGVIAIFKGMPEEQSWMQVKDGLRKKLPEKVQVYFVSQVSNKNECVVAVAPFDNDTSFFEELKLELGGVTLSSVVASGDELAVAVRMLPKNIKEKREKNARNRAKERNRPILLGTMKFVNVAALRGRVREILNSRTDGECLKPEGGDFKLLVELLKFHPKGDEKSKGLKGMKVAKSTKGDNRCFWLIRENGEEEDFSVQKCLGALELNPPYEAPKEKPAAQAEAKKDAVRAEEKKDEKPVQTKPSETKPAEDAKMEGAKVEEKPAEKPAETTPAESKPAESKPAVAKMEEKPVTA